MASWLPKFSTKVSRKKKTSKRSVLNPQTKGPRKPERHPTNESRNGIAHLTNSSVRKQTEKRGYFRGKGTNSPMKAIIICAEWKHTIDNGAPCAVFWQSVALWGELARAVHWAHRIVSAVYLRFKVRILRQKRSLLRPLPTRTRASRHCTVPTTYLAHIWAHPKKRKHITPVVVDGSTRKMKISCPNPNGREGFRKASKSSRNSRMPGISRCRWTNVFLSLRKTPEYTSATMAVCASKACWEIARTLCGDGLYKCMNGVYRLHCVKQVILNDVKL